MNHHEIARSTVLLGMEPRLPNEHLGAKDPKELWQMVVTAYQTELPLKIFDIRGGLFGLRVENCASIDSYVSR